MANLEIKLSANKRQPYLRHRVVGRVGDGGLTTINVQLLEEDEITPFVINLNGTLKFVGEVSNGNYTEGEPEIIDSTNGLISYTFTKSNFSTSHQFKQAYFEYVDPNGKKVTFQNFIIDVLERVDINSEQAKYYISSLEKLQSEMQTTFNQFISDKQVQYDQIYSKYNELVRLINESDKQANDRIDKANDRIDKANNRIDQTNQQIGDLGKLKKMYSNSIDFGDYDYSGRANLAPNLDFSKFSGDRTLMIDPLACFKDHGTYVELDSSDPSVVNASRNIYVPNCSALLPNNTYIMTVPIMINADFDDFRTAFVLKASDGTALGTVNPPRENVGTWQNVTKVFTVPNNLKFDNSYLQLWQPKEGNGKLYIGYDIKIEKVNSTSDTATPYQPNLLVDPYWLGKTPLGENIAQNTNLPVATSNQLITEQKLSSYLVKGETYTVTLEGTKPANQGFSVFIADVGNTKFGDMTPVEGLTNQWELTFTYNKDTQTSGIKLIRIYQRYSELGSCTIKWLKIEKGDTRTPNISQCKYFGEGLKDSNNPNDYSWDVTPEYAEKGLNNTVSLTEPQSIEGLKNFEDGIQSKGKSVLTSDDNKYEVVTLTVTNGNTG
ncbi:TPA: BppU family phage baseplate upper protein, partial [Enterococcus faecium]